MSKKADDYVYKLFRIEKIKNKIETFILKKIGKEKYEDYALKIDVKRKDKGWKYLKNGVLIYSLFGTGIIFIHNFVPIENYVKNTQTVVLSSIDSISTKETFMSSSFESRFKGTVNGEEKYFIKYCYPTQYIKTDLFFHLTPYKTLISKDNFKNQGTKNNPIQFVYINPDKEISSKYLFTKWNIQQFLVSTARYSGIGLKDVRSIGFYILIIWFLVYCFYLFFMKEN